MKRVVLTGGTGFVGANLARRLLRDGHEVHLLVRPGFQDWRIAEVRDAIRLHDAAIENGERVETVLREVRPDWVFHLGVYGAYSSQADLWRMVRTNIEGTLHVAAACRQAGCGVMVNTGSSSEYGFTDHAPREEELVEPNGYYAFTKASATLFCRFAASNWGMRIPTLRLYSVYGPYEDPTRLVPTLLAAVLNRELPPLVAGNIARDYVYVDDVCEAYIAAAADQRGEAGAVYNVGTGLQTTIREMVELATELTPVDVQPQWGSMSNREWDASTWVADPGKIRRELGWQPRWALRDGLQATLEWLQEDSQRLELYRLEQARNRT